MSLKVAVTGAYGVFAVTNARESGEKELPQVYASVTCCSASFCYHECMIYMANMRNVPMYM